MFHSLVGGRSSNHLFSIRAQPMTRRLLDAPLSRGMTLSDSLVSARALIDDGHLLLR